MRLDALIYRIFKLWHLEEALRLTSLWLYPPGAWEDPEEAMIEQTFVEDSQHHQEPLRHHALPAYARD